MKPNLSVVIPVFNENPIFFKTCLISIKNQTFKNFECIIVDESTNNDAKDTFQATVFSDTRFKFYKKKNLGLAKSLNYGISKSKSTLIARFDSDDVCDKNRFKVQVEFLINNPNVSVCGTNVNFLQNSKIKKNNFSNFPTTHDEIIKYLSFKSPFAHPSVIIRKYVFKKYGLYRNLKYSEDLDLWLRLSKKKDITFANLSQTLVSLRLRIKPRPFLHWYYNIYVRISNMPSKNIIRDLFYISLLILFALLPNFLKKRIFYWN